MFGEKKSVVPFEKFELFISKLPLTNALALHSVEARFTRLHYLEFIEKSFISSEHPVTFLCKPKVCYGF